jgi:hypothetical protein
VILNHLNLAVSDVQKARGLLVKYFGLDPGGKPGNDTRERVDEINRRLKEDGFEVDPPARIHGSWAFYFRAPGGFVIKVPC